MVNVGVLVGLLLIPLGALHILTAHQAEHARTFMLGMLVARSRRGRIAFGWAEVALGVLVVALSR